jgi:apolipoprotein D and lipocalin family protein
MIRTVAAALAALLIGLPAAAATYRDRSVPMQSVPVDLSRYYGKWYEIARFPNQFETDCVGVTAEYAPRADGKIQVINTCRKGQLTGTVDRIEGEAWAVAPGQLKVTFVPWLPFAKGDYWVLHVEPDYSMAVVGEPKGRTGWILARTPTLGQDHLGRALQALRANGYDTTKLYYVPQK